MGHIASTPCSMLPALFTLEAETHNAPMAGKLSVYGLT